MKIIHTSDWHLGKNLEGNSRLQEQERFLNNFVDIVKEKSADMVIIAGDIYDNGNPPAKAETIFYDCIKRISVEGNCAVLIVAGNHDNPERLEAVTPLAGNHGILILGSPKSKVEPGRYGSFHVLASEEGVTEIMLRQEKAVIITLPYPSEKRLGEILSKGSEEEELQKSYSARIGEIFQNLSRKYREDTVNIAVSHLYVTGGEVSDSERAIQLGGTYAVELLDLPSGAQYIALGHLHKTQVFNSGNCPVIYSGSPLKYSRKERNNKNCIFFMNLKAGQKAEPEKIYLPDSKPIEVWQFGSIEEAIEKCKDDGERELWVYLEINCDRVISQKEIKQMREYRKDIIEIKPIFKSTEDKVEAFENLTEKTMEEVFNRFYLWKNQVPPTQELVELFLNIADEET